MTLRSLLCMSAALLIADAPAAMAGKTVDEAGTMACVIDKWNETEPKKGHKLVDYASRCVLVPDDSAAPKVTEACEGKYEYMPPDGKSWQASGTCTDTVKGGDTKSFTWEEGSHLTAYPYKYIGGTGRYQGASGSGTYIYENLTDTLVGGRYKGKLMLP